MCPNVEPNNKVKKHSCDFFYEQSASDVFINTLWLFIVLPRVGRQLVCCNMKKMCFIELCQRKCHVTSLRRRRFATAGGRWLHVTVLSNRFRLACVQHTCRDTVKPVYFKSGRTYMFCLCACLWHTHALILQTTDRRPVKSIPQVWS